MTTSTIESARRCPSNTRVIRAKRLPSLNDSVSGGSSADVQVDGTCEDLAAEDFAIHRVHPSAVFAGAGRHKNAVAMPSAINTTASNITRCSSIMSPAGGKGAAL
jgi:hypothetical protein